MLDWVKEWALEQFAVLLTYAAKNPFEFIFYVLLILSPFFAVSALLSHQLSKAIEKEQKVRYIQ